MPEVSSNELFVLKQRGRAAISGGVSTHVTDFRGSLSECGNQPMEGYLLLWVLLECQCHLVVCIPRQYLLFHVTYFIQRICLLVTMRKTVL